MDVSGLESLIPILGRKLEVKASFSARETDEPTPLQGSGEPVTCIHSHVSSRAA